ncbi:MAG TPA: DUF6789 family protein [Chloroflexota bacterium]|jgi:hypothetical protein|nr:DUF6789 family protein [Chloroflexota bacterium]
MATVRQRRVADHDWTARAVVSGFIATIAMGIVLIIGYVIAVNAGDRGGGTFLHWLYGLSHNQITNITKNAFIVACALYLAFGLIWALIYVRLFEPLLSGPGWMKGLVFSMIPFLLSVLVFLPSLGGGFLGVDLHAGPLPFIGNFILHVVYGLVLGSTYSGSDTVGESGDDAAEDLGTERLVLHSTNQKSAIGMLIGIFIGAILGVILGVNVYPPSTAAASANLITGAGELSLAGAVLGAALGALVGSMFGLDANQADEP